MNRTLKLPLMLALALGSTSAMALSVGQIRVKSALDAPFLADIPLTADYPGETRHVSVELASAADFKRAGLDRSQIKAHLNFKVVTNSKGQRVIRVTSTQPVHATYLDFLIKVSWPKGSMLREFTALLDPRGMANSQPVNSPPASSGGAAKATSTATHRTTTGQAGSADATSRIHNDKYGPVRSGETLSEIAEQAKRQGVTLNQMLIALYKANPGAFYRQNINALKRGAVLRIPSQDQATAESVAAAMAAVRRQNSDWQGNAAGSPTMVAHAGGRPGAGKAASGGNSGDHLSLVPPQSGGSGGAHPGTAGGSGNTSVAGLRQDLSRAKESLSNAQQENADLKSRVSSLKSINDKNGKLLSLKSAQIAELQQKLKQARKAAGMPPAPASTAAAAAVPATATSTATAATASTAPATAGGRVAMAASAAAPGAAMSTGTTAAATPPVAARKTPPQKAPTPAPVSRHRAASSTPWFMQPWAWLVGAVVVIILLLLGWAGSRRKRASAADGKPSLADQFGDSPFGPSGDVMDGDESMDADQRELLAQLAEHPDDVGLHLELVSLYYARSDAEHFEGAAEAMYVHVSDPEQPEWQDVLAMGRELTPEHPLFAEHDDLAADPVTADPADVAPVADESMDSELDLGGYVSEHDAEDIDEDGADDAILPDHADEQADTSGYSFDFDLTPQRNAVTSGEDGVPQAPTEDEYDALPPLPEDDAREPASADDALERDDSPAQSQDVPVDTAEADTVDDDTVDENPVDVAGAHDDSTRFDDVAPVSDDPVDTKLDLARAYIDMGDPEGARAMLDEVLAEGSQMQKDVASKLLDEMN